MAESVGGVSLCCRKAGQRGVNLQSPPRVASANNENSRDNWGRNNFVLGGIHPRMKSQKFAGQRDGLRNH